MKDRTFLTIAFLVALVGIAMIFFLMRNYEVESKAIGELSCDDYGSDIVVEGVVREHYSSENITVINISQKSSMKVVLFQKVSGIQRGQRLEVKGKFKEYKGEDEIIADRIEKKGSKN